MRKIFVFLSCLITAPAIAADDACTKPKEFTVDKRCYVTSAQKKQKPFNATVGLVNGDLKAYCTGTIVKGYYGYNGDKATTQEKETIYVYTAKHCTDRNKDGKPDTYLDIVLQNGDSYKIKFARAGQYKILSDEKAAGDYALYTIDEQTDIPGSKIPYTTISDKWGFLGLRQLDARVVGYGTLKIMSDKEIKIFKSKYINFMKQQGMSAKDSGVKISTKWGTKFMQNLDHDYQNDLFANHSLKVSNCKYHSVGTQIGCQAWSGNSGGGIFDNNGELMGIYTRGHRIVGGENHAASITTTKYPSTIPIAF